ncbi:MAG: hypothetical protein IKO27_02190 [Ruminococcus sp.]|nr:hypothetical protein [Ruminococcus sp.]
MTYAKRCAASLLAALLIMLLPGAALKAFAGTALMTVPDKVMQGVPFEVTVTFSAESSLGMAETDIVYDSSMLTYTGGLASGGRGVLHLRAFPDGSSGQITASLSFTPQAQGSTRISISNCTLSFEDGSPAGSAGCDLTVNVVENDGSEVPLVTDIAPGSDDSEQPRQTIEKDENGIPVMGVLKSLSVSEGELAPAFSPLIFDYSVKVGSDVLLVEVDAETISDTDYIWFEGTKWLGDTGTTRKITVTDVYGNKNTYRIVFTKEPAETVPAVTEPAEVTSVTETEAVTAVQPAVTSEITAEQSSSSQSSEASSSKQSGMSELKDKLMPALLIILAALVLALIIMIIWVKTKSERRRRKIKSSGGKR